MTKVIGITGGIGSGKTTVCNYLKKNINKDAVKNNKINKQKITDIIFSSPKIRKALEAHVHKQVKKSRDSFIIKNIKNKKSAVFVDIPLLFENKLEKSFDAVLCVIAKKKIRRERVLKNKKFTKNILEKIFKSQTTDSERKKKSKIIIYNNKTKKDFIFSAERALMELLK